jgi:hypothetical protein
MFIIIAPYQLYRVGHKQTRMYATRYSKRWGGGELVRLARHSDQVLPRLSGLAHLSNVADRLLLEKKQAPAMYFVDENRPKLNINVTNQGDFILLYAGYLDLVYQGLELGLLVECDRMLYSTVFNGGDVELMRHFYVYRYMNWDTGEFKGFIVHVNTMAVVSSLEHLRNLIRAF